MPYQNTVIASNAGIGQPLTLAWWLMSSFGAAPTVPILSFFG
jgi:hypothetical protein